jgi:hypothetical protein
MGSPKDKGQRREIARAKDGDTFWRKKKKPTKKKKLPYNRKQQEWEE